MRTEIVKIIQYLREGNQEKAEAFAKQLEINSEKSNNPDDKRFAKRILDAFYGVPVDPEKTVCLDGKGSNNKLIQNMKSLKQSIEELKEYYCGGYPSEAGDVFETWDTFISELEGEEP